MRLKATALALACAAALGAASNGLTDAKVFPIPWKPGTGDPAFDTAFVTFANLSAGTEVTVFTLRGQRVWKGVADATGTLLWSGASDRGRMVASGTYLALLNGGGAKTTRRVVVIR